jgi:predicted nucleic acid-binding protein
MKVLLDTNILLDVLLARSPFLAQSQLVWQASDDGRIEGCIAAVTPPNIFHIVRRLIDAARARECVIACIDAFEILPLDHASTRVAVDRNGMDFEDDIQIACCIASNVAAIVTRDPSGFAKAPIPVFDPASLVTTLGP